jgi:hypothetical protein
MSQVSTTTNLALALENFAGTTASRRIIVEPAEDGPLFVKLLQKTSLPMEDSEGRSLRSSKENGHHPKPCKNLGFVKLASLKSSTFADARGAISKDLETLAFEWRFFVPGLGPMSLRQEADLGPIYSFLRRTTLDQHLGDGTLLHPLRVFIVEQETVITPTPTTTTAATTTTSNAPES